MTYMMYDAAYFTEGMLAGDIIAGYIGGERAAHVWGDPAWEMCGSKPKLPIWVPPAQAGWQQARADVWNILSEVLHYKIPRNQVIGFDLETSQADYEYVSAMSIYLTYFGYHLMAYGSSSTIHSAVPAGIWLWDADWNKTPHINPGSLATQWTDGPLYDMSVATQELYDLCPWRQYEIGY